MKYFYGNYSNTKDSLTKGKILIYNDHVMVSYTSKMNQNYLINSFISKYKLKNISKSDILFLNYTHEGERIVISPARPVDDTLFERDYDKNVRLIKLNLE